MTTFPIIPSLLRLWRMFPFAKFPHSTTNTSDDLRSQISLYDDLYSSNQLLRQASVRSSYFSSVTTPKPYRLLQSPPRSPLYLCWSHASFPSAIHLVELTTYHHNFVSPPPRHRIQIKPYLPQPPTHRYCLPAFPPVVSYSKTRSISELS